MIELQVIGKGVVAPGLHGWREARDALNAEGEFRPGPLARQLPVLLAGAERRRCTEYAAWALNAAHEAVQSSGRDRSTFATVFTSSDGDGAIVDRLCAALATPGESVSPIQFQNSVHNAAAGYWSIAANAKGSSVALCAAEGSFAAGLLEAACYAAVEKQPVLLVAIDLPYPPPLQAHRPVGAGFAAALALAPAFESGSGGARLRIGLLPDLPCTPPPERLRIFAGNAAAACLPLLAALARTGAAEVRLPYDSGVVLSIQKLA